MDVLFARPDDLDRPVDLLRDAHGLADIVHFEPPAETAADQVVVDDNLLERQPGHLRCDSLRAGNDLIADPDLARVGTNVHGAVHRLHRRMCEERHVVGRLKFRPLAQSLGDVAGRFRDRARFLARGDKAVQHIGRGHLGVRPFVPRDVEDVEALLGGPHVVADDRDEIVENDDLADPRHGLRPLVVDMRELAAEHWAARERGDLHARRPRVDAIDGFTVDLVGRVEPFQRLADQLEIRGRFQRRILWRRQSGSGLGKLAIGGLLGARVVKNLAVLRPAGRRSDAPLRRRGLHQHGPGGRARNPHRLPKRANGGRAAGHLEAEKRVRVELVVRRRRDRGHVFEGRIKLLCEDHGEGGVDALSHLDLRDCEGDLAVRVYAHESVWREIRARLRRERRVEPGNGEAED